MKCPEIIKYLEMVDDKAKQIAEKCIISAATKIPVICTQSEFVQAMPSMRNITTMFFKLAKAESLLD
jgi:hypothetical protein